MAHGTPFHLRRKQERADRGRSWTLQEELATGVVVGGGRLRGVRQQYWRSGHEVGDELDRREKMSDHRGSRDEEEKEILARNKYAPS